MAEIAQASLQSELGNDAADIMDVDGNAGQAEADEQEEEIAEVNDKIEIMKGYEADLSAATYVLHEEDHTLGNALRYMLMKNPLVEFCGYTNPHPSEPKIHLRIQMYDGKSSLLALREALDNLQDLFNTIEETYTSDLAKKEYIQAREPGLNEEEMRNVIEQTKQVKRSDQKASG